MKTLHNVPFEHSLLVRLGGAIAAIAMMAVLGMAVSSMVAFSTRGSGEAINLAGSLRMQSWHMASLHLAGGEPRARQARLDQAIARFDATLVAPPILAMLPGSSESRLSAHYAAVTGAWYGHIRPGLLAAAQGSRADPADAAAAEATLARLADFVALINDLVKQMEEATEAKIQVMQGVLGVALVVTVLVVLLTVYLIHNGLVKPLHALLGMTERASRGDLSGRTEHVGEDELGHLGASFNQMAGELAKLYQNLEARVEQKTAELTRSNRSLELLYHSIAKLHGSPPGQETYVAVLRDIEAVLGVGHGIICLGEPGGSRGRAIATTMEPGDANPCEKAECVWCHGTETPRVSIREDGRQLLTLPLSDAERQYGVLIVDVPQGGHPEAWQVQLLEALSRHIGVAIGAEQRIEQGRKLALLEERAVIARELHDSLAQSLAYMKIQVSRLQAAMPPETAEAAASRGEDGAGAILAELREGLSGAYRQLRELLSTFRLGMEGGDLRAALARTVAEFAERGGLPVELAVSHDRCPLSPNEEIHLLHILREALSNVLNHARARHAWVRVGCDAEGMLEASVEDDGGGIGKSAAPHHYGMTIMEERARSLHGEVLYLARPEGGTRVLLRFRPASRRPLPIPVKAVNP